MQPGDVPVTYADTSALERDFGFKPSTSLRTGLRKFADLESRVLTQKDWDLMWDSIKEWSGNLSRDVKSSANSIVPKVQDLLRENKEILSQDGKTREQFFSRLNTETDNRMEAFSDMISEMKKWIMGLIAGTGIASALLSTVICLLMR